MKLIRGLWVGAILLLVFQGCSKDPDVVKGVGSYSPIITGLAIDNEPAWRGVPNQLTVQVNNVNGLPLTVHWSAAIGELTDSTGLSASWTPPDSIGTYDVTVSLEATDPAENNKYYFKTQTYHVAVGNQYERWTHTEAVQYDPAPIGQGAGLLFSQIRNNATGESDVWRLDAPMAGPTKIVSDFWIANSPSPRADRAEVIFAGRRRPSDPASIWLVDWAGGDTTSARVVASVGTIQTILQHPRFAPSGTLALYTSDTTLTTHPRVWRRDVSNFALPPSPMLSEFFPFFNDWRSPNWGPDIDNDDFPDSIITRGYFSFGGPGESRGLFKFGFANKVDPAPDELLALPDTAAAEPDWSEDGEYIVYSRRNDGATDRDIWIMRADTNEPANAIRVTSGPADDSHPRFSPDGMTIYFVSTRADRYGLNGLYPTERRGTNLWSVRLFDRP
jgi:WD40 repeat protein